MSRNHDTKYTTVVVVCDTILQSSDTIILDLKLDWSEHHQIHLQLNLEPNFLHQNIKTWAQLEL